MKSKRPRIRQVSPRHPSQDSDEESEILAIHARLVSSGRPSPDITNWMDLLKRLLLLLSKTFLPLSCVKASSEVQWCSGNLDTDETRLRPQLTWLKRVLVLSLPDDDH